MNSKERKDDDDNISIINVKVNNDKEKVYDKDNNANYNLHKNSFPDQNYYSNYDSYNKTDLLSKEDELNNFLSFLEKKKKENLACFS